MLQRLFFDHPRSVGETYAQHFATASHFGVRLVLAGLACWVHGFIPAMFTTTGSRAVKALHNDMIANRRRDMREWYMASDGSHI